MGKKLQQQILKEIRAHKQSQCVTHVKMTGPEGELIHLFPVEKPTGSDADPYYAEVDWSHWSVTITDSWENSCTDEDMWEDFNDLNPHFDFLSLETDGEYGPAQMATVELEYRSG